jgi:hypothetical protein
MPEKKTIDAAKKDKAEGKSASTQAGEFVKEQIDKIRHGEHGARSPQQAIAIGLSEARRAGIDLKPPAKGKYSKEVRTKAEHDSDRGHQDPNHKPNPKRSQATENALKRESHEAASHEALSEHAKTAAANRTKHQRSEAALKAARSRTPEQRSESARKAAETRKRNA